MNGTNFSDGAIALGGKVDHYLINDAGNCIFIRCTAANLPTGAGYAIGCMAEAVDSGVLYYNSGTASAATFTAINAGAAALTIPTALTDSTSTTGASLATVANSVTSGKALSLTTTGLTTGSSIYLSAVAGTMTTGKYIECYNGAADVFTVGKYGATVIAGNASTTVLTLTAGNQIITAGNLTLTNGNIVLTANASTISCTGTGANGMVLTNLKNSSTTALSGTKLDIEISIGGTPYYFEVYPTKA
jgi:hypothetical protein